MKAGDIGAELGEAKNAVGTLGGRLERVYSYTLPGEGAVMSVPVIRKVRRTDAKYPAGRPRSSKNPSDSPGARQASPARPTKGAVFLLSSLKRFVGRLILPDLTALHWRCYRRALQAKGLRGSLLRARVRRLQRKQCADIPIKQDITPFTTPHGLSGIFISKGAVIGEGCTLFQQVTVGSNTLQGSAPLRAP